MLCNKEFALAKIINSKKVEFSPTFCEAQKILQVENSLAEELLTYFILFNAFTGAKTLPPRDHANNYTIMVANWMPVNV